MKQNQQPKTPEELFLRFRALFTAYYKEDLNKADCPLAIAQAQGDLEKTQNSTTFEELSDQLIDADMGQYQIFHALLEAWFGQIPEVLELALREV